jgi:hypothetical protein
MFESEEHIFIEMEYIQGEQLKKVYDCRLEYIHSLMGGYSEEEIRQRQIDILLK